MNLKWDSSSNLTLAKYPNFTLDLVIYLLNCVEHDLPNLLT